MYTVRTGSANLRAHLALHHLATWINSCDAEGLEIKTGSHQNLIDDYRRQAGQAVTAPSSLTRISDYTPGAFLDALVDFFVVHDLVSFACPQVLLSSNIFKPVALVDSTWLRALLGMLRPSLADKDIPGRTSLTARIVQRMDILVDSLKREFKV